MPVLVIPLRDDGAFLDVGLGASRGLIIQANRPATFRALIDTGADVTAIDPEVIAQLGLQKIGTLPVARAGGGISWHETFDVRVRFGGHRGPGRWYSVEAVAARPATPETRLLIGMDLLMRVRWRWDGPARVAWLDH